MVRITGHKINRKAIEKSIGKSRAFQSKALAEANKKLTLAKRNLINEFNNHAVTRELEDGSGGSNISGSLDGYGNLFSFMGFSGSSHPTESVRKFLQSFIKITPGGRAGSAMSKDFFVKIPTLRDFDFAKMPWEGGNSWVGAVERGMSSFSYYMHKAHESSRAGVGIQIDNKLRGKSSKPVQYMTQILDNFRRRLSK
jgi:hypothetical protein